MSNIFFTLLIASQTLEKASTKPRLLIDPESILSSSFSKVCSSCGPGAKKLGSSIVTRLFLQRLRWAGSECLICLLFFTNFQTRKGLFWFEHYFLLTWARGWAKNFANLCIVESDFIHSAHFMPTITPQLRPKPRPMAAFNKLGVFVLISYFCSDLSFSRR